MTVFRFSVIPSTVLGINFKKTTPYIGINNEIADLWCLSARLK